MTVEPVNVCSVFGRQSVENGIFEWKLKFKTKIEWICIGVIKDDETIMKENQTRNRYGMRVGHGCSVVNANGCLYYGQGNSFVGDDYCDLFTEINTIIAVRLDKDKSTIQYKINDKQFEVIEGIDLNGKAYRLAVTMSGEDTEIVLL